MGDRTIGTTGVITTADVQYLESLVARATCGADMAALRGLNDAMACVPASAEVVQAALRRVLAGGRPLPQQQLGANLLHSLLVSSAAFRHAVGASAEWHRLLAGLVASPAAPAPVRTAIVRMLQATAALAAQDPSYRPFATLWTTLVQRGYIRFAPPPPPPPPLPAAQLPQPLPLPPPAPATAVSTAAAASTQPPPMQSLHPLPQQQQQQQKQQKQQQQKQEQPVKPQRREGTAAAKAAAGDRAVAQQGVNLVDIAVGCESLRRAVARGDVHAAGTPVAEVRAAAREAEGLARDLTAARRRVQAALGAEAVLAQPHAVALLLDANTQLNAVLADYDAFALRSAGVSAARDAPPPPPPVVERLSSSFRGLLGSALGRTDAAETGPDALQRHYNELAESAALAHAQCGDDASQTEAEALPVPDVDADETTTEEAAEGNTDEEAEAEARVRQGVFVSTVEFDGAPASTPSSSPSTTATTRTTKSKTKGPADSDMLAPKTHARRTRAYGLADAYMMLYGCDSL